MAIIDRVGYELWTLITLELYIFENCAVCTQLRSSSPLRSFSEEIKVQRVDERPL